MTSSITVADTVLADHPAIEELSKQFLDEMRETELKVVTGYTLADAIREGSSVTEQAIGGYRKGDQVCALSAAVIAAKARGFLA